MATADTSLTPGAAGRIELLQTFVRIVEAGSLSAAAAQLGATQPTVSRRLQALERSLGLRLLNRSTHAMKLTDDGERCFERAKQMLGDWEAFEADLRGAGDEPEGMLRVVAPHAFGQEALVGSMVEYLRRYPRVSVDWLLYDRTPDFIAEGIDCAIQLGEISDPSVVALKLTEVPRIAVAAPALLEGRPPPTHANELATLPWLALRTFYRTELALTCVQSRERVRLPIRPRLSTDSLYALRNATLMGLGASIVSAWSVTDDIAQGRLVHLAPRWCAAPLAVHLVYPQTRYQPARLRRFIDAMRVAVPQALGSAQLSSDVANPGRLQGRAKKASTSRTQ